MHGATQLGLGPKRVQSAWTASKTKRPAAKRMLTCASASACLTKERERRSSSAFHSLMMSSTGLPLTSLGACGREAGGGRRKSNAASQMLPGVAGILPTSRHVQHSAAAAGRRTRPHASSCYAAPCAPSQAQHGFAHPQKLKFKLPCQSEHAHTPAGQPRAWHPPLPQRLLQGRWLPLPPRVPMRRRLPQAPRQRRQTQRLVLRLLRGLPLPTRLLRGCWQS